jgi:hypothetical protein
LYKLRAFPADCPHVPTIFTARLLKQDEDFALAKVHIVLRPRPKGKENK